MSAAPSAARKVLRLPRTVDGKPDFQGVWDFSTITPLERPAALAGKEFLTDEEAAELQRQAALESTDDARKSRDEARGSVGSYNRVWLGLGTTVVATKRTSLIVDPRDGKIPPLTPAAQARQNAREAAKEHPAGPEDFDLIDRCIVGFNSGPPMLPDIYNNYIQVFQSRDHLVILNEMVHNARIIPTDDQPHLGQAIQQKVGDSRGHWAGDTFVVDTTNFSDEGMSLDVLGPTRFRGLGGRHMHLIERFTLENPNLLLYEFTVDDPTTYTRPWTVALTMVRSLDKLFEYACHEGNYGLPNTLNIERAAERSASTTTPISVERASRPTDVTRTPRQELKP